MLPKGLRVGYLALNRDFSHPGDSRRFAGYAKARGLSLEFAEPDRRYDLVVISQKADLSVWSSYRLSPVIYDFTDSYLAVPRTNLKAAFRGFAKFATGESRFLRLDHRAAIELMCRNSRAVVCVTEEQKRDISAFSPNVHVILDDLSIYESKKTDYSSGSVVNLVWEGYPENLLAFEEIRDILREVDRKMPLALHVLTKLEVARFMGRFLTRPTTSVLRRILNRTLLYEWNEKTAPAIIAACDLAIIPINLNDRLTAGKPENKLHAFWRMGLPTLVSATPAYKRAMVDAGLDMACASPSEWRDALYKYTSDPEARRQAAALGRESYQRRAAQDILWAQWDVVLESVLK